MAINWSLYNTRLNINGTTKRERDIHDYKQTLKNKLPDSPSCKSVKINNVDRSLEFVKTNDDKIKIIHSLPNEIFNSGEYVIYKSKTFIITKVDTDDEIYTSGKMEECNYSLTFQHPTTGAILSYPSITSSTRLGQEEGKVFTLGNNQKSILVPFDQITVLLGVSKRLYVDKNITNPPYKVIGIDNTSHDGLIELIVQEDVHNPLVDKPDLGVCDYFEPQEEPDPVNPEVPTIVVTITSDTTDNEVKLGLTYHFTATLTNELGETVVNTQPRYTINNTYGGKVILTDNLNGTATIKVNDSSNDLLGSQFTLQCMDMYSGFYSSITFIIVSLW